MCSVNLLWDQQLLQAPGWDVRVQRCRTVHADSLYSGPDLSQELLPLRQIHICLQTNTAYA